jgi:intracellular multiplication protein IcmJ
MRKTKLPPLIPSIKLKSFRQNSPESELLHRNYIDKRGKILKRDKYTCQYCGFTTIPDRKASPDSLEFSGYLEIHHINNNHKDNRDENLVSLCPFCHQVLHVGFAGHSGRMRLIYFPWLSQEKLNILVNAIFVAIHRKGKYEESATMFYVWLQNFSGIISMMYDEKLDNPETLGSALSVMAKKKPKLYKNRKRFLKNIRILPEYKSFSKQIDYWSNKSWNKEIEWEKIYNNNQIQL